MSPLVTIVMPCHNSARHLHTSIGCVLQQTLPHWTLIAVDDGSVDTTAELLDEYAGADPRIIVVHQQNRGVSHARNRALRAGRTPFVAFLDADDSWAPEFLSEMTSALTSAPDAVLAYCGWQNVGLPGESGSPFVPPNYEGPRKAALLLESCRWPIHAALVRLQAVRQAGLFNENLARSEDFDLWLRVALDSPIIRVPKVLAYYHHHAGIQATKNRAAAMLDQWKVKKAAVKAHPKLSAAIPSGELRNILHAPLLAQANECYWRNEFDAAQAGFRQLMRNCYGGPSDWLRMMPSLLPLAIYGPLIRAVRKFRRG